MVASRPIPQIDNGKRPGEQLNVRHSWRLPSDTPYGNLLLKSLAIVERIDHVNRLIQQVYDEWAPPHEVDPDADPKVDILKHRITAEEVVYWIRKTADELVQCSRLFQLRIEEGDWPEIIRPDSIGEMLGDVDCPLWSELEPRRPFLEKLNAISNAYKHSFINSDFVVVGAFEPAVFAATHPRNDLRRELELHDVPFDSLVNQFNDFYVGTKCFIEGLAGQLE